MWILKKAWIAQGRKKVLHTFWKVCIIRAVYSRKRMRRTKEEALETRKAILKVALDCFSKRGYALTTFNDIARRIHLTKGAVFWHFKSKEELLAELIEREPS